MSFEDGMGRGERSRRENARSLVVGLANTLHIFRDCIFVASAREAVRLT